MKMSRKWSKAALRRARRYDPALFAQRLIELSAVSGRELEKELSLMLEQGRVEHVRQAMARLERYGIPGAEAANRTARLIQTEPHCWGDSECSSQHRDVRCLELRSNRGMSAVVAYVQAALEDMSAPPPSQVLKQIEDPDLRDVVLAGLEIAAGSKVRRRLIPKGIRAMRIRDMGRWKGLRRKD